VFAHVFDNAGYTLLHVATRGEPALQAEVVVQAMLPVRGPVLRGDEVLLTRDEELMRWIPGSIELSNSPLGTLPLTCLTDDYACTRSLLFESDRVEQAGVLDPELALFDLAELEDPTLYSADPELGEYCTAQWLVFQADLMRAGITDGDGGLAMPGSDAGLDSGFESADAGDAATTEDAALDTDSGHDDAGVARATHSDGCSAVRIAQHASELKSAWLSLGLCAAAIYLRRRLAHARRAW